MPEAVMRALEDTEDDFNWIDEHFGELREEYSGQYVAVKDGEVVAHASNSEDLHRQLTERSVDMVNVAVKFIREAGEYIIR